MIHYLQHNNSNYRFVKLHSTKVMQRHMINYVHMGTVIDYQCYFDAIWINEIIVASWNNSRTLLNSFGKRLNQFQICLIKCYEWFQAFRTSNIKDVNISIHSNVLKWL